MKQDASAWFDAQTTALRILLLNTADHAAASYQADPGDFLTDLIDVARAYESDAPAQEQQT